jgi:transcriptional regulator with XRE-family HTH domain
MSNTSQAAFVQDAWQTPRNARTLRAFMALQQREIGERIAELRKSRGNPPQEVVAHQLGVSYRAYQAWEAGDSKPAYRNLSKLAAFYGVTEEFILLGGDMPERQLPQLDRIEQLLVANSERLEALEAGFTALRAAVVALSADSLQRTREQQERAGTDLPAPRPADAG